MAKKKSRRSSASRRYGSTITLAGKRISLKKHPTDFSVIGHTTACDADNCAEHSPLARGMVRLTASSSRSTDGLMDNARGDAVAHHIYLVEDTDEEIVIDHHIVVSLTHEGAGEIQEIAERHSLGYVRRMGRDHVLRVTGATGMNPLKAANEIAELPGVRECAPLILLPLQRHQPPALFSRQWYLTSDLVSHPDLVPDAGVQAPEAWTFGTGSRDIVVAVIDDGYDLGHPAFSGVNIHADATDFEGDDSSASAEGGDYHGTPVASIAVGSHVGSAMRGIAPGCTFLPVRIGFGPTARPIDILDVFDYVSARADVVNCSFGLGPSSFDRMNSAFRQHITGLTENGGRRGKGLVMVFSAGNDDAPTFLPAAANVNGVKYTRNRQIFEIPAGRDVFSGYPMTDGVVVVASMSSLKRKSGYSSWGPHISVTAPSNNQHYIMDFVHPSDPNRAAFVANYRGVGQIAASNRVNHGAAFQPLSDDPATPSIRENHYTDQFGGTSGAAPVVSGIVALMLSANPQLTAPEVKQILMSTADQNLDMTTDLANDPNLQGLSGEFLSGHSRFFGAGKVNAFRAVSRAAALAGGEAGILAGTVSPGLTIPDNLAAGIVSSIDITGSGSLIDIEVQIDIDHSWRGDLKVVLISPQSFSAELHSRSGGSADDIDMSYTPANSAELAALVDAGIDVRGRWTLHVSDHARRDVGTLHRWSLSLATTQTVHS